MANKKKNQSKKQNNKQSVKVQKKSTSKKNEVLDNSSSLKGIYWVIIITMLVFGAFYLLTLYLTRDTTKKEEQSYYSSPFSTLEIMAGRSFSMEDGEYFVLFYDSSDEDLESTYSSIISSYRAKGELSIYTVKMDNGLNKGYSKEESNTHPNSASELAINGPTLIKINNHEVALYNEGEESIRSTLE